MSTISSSDFTFYDGSIKNQCRVWRYVNSVCRVNMSVFKQLSRLDVLFKRKSKKRRCDDDFRRMDE